MRLQQGVMAARHGGASGGGFVRRYDGGNHATRWTKSGTLPSQDRARTCRAPGMGNMRIQGTADCYRMCACAQTRGRWREGMGDSFSCVGHGVGLCEIIQRSMR